jgi:hypothetical protein
LIDAVEIREANQEQIALGLLGLESRTATPENVIMAHEQGLLLPRLLSRILVAKAFSFV